MSIELKEATLLRANGGIFYDKIFSFDYEVGKITENLRKNLKEYLKDKKMPLDYKANIEGMVNKNVEFTHGTQEKVSITDKSITFSKDLLKIDTFLSYANFMCDVYKVFLKTLSIEDVNLIGINFILGIPFKKEKSVIEYIQDNFFKFNKEIQERLNVTKLISPHFKVTYEAKNNLCRLEITNFKEEALLVDFDISTQSAEEVKNCYKFMKEAFEYYLDKIGDLLSSLLRSDIIQSDVLKEGKLDK